LVYLDETGIGKNDIEMFAWTKKGTIKPIKVEGKRSKRVNVIAAKIRSLPHFYLKEAVTRQCLKRISKKFFVQL
jgi:hypothetical protein